MGRQTRLIVGVVLLACSAGGVLWMFLDGDAGERADVIGALAGVGALVVSALTVMRPQAATADPVAPGAAASTPERHRTPFSLSLSPRARIVALAAVVIVSAGLILKSVLAPAPPSVGPGPDFVALPTCDTANETLHIVSSQEKAGLLASLATEYGPREANGRCVAVRVTAKNSGRILDQLIHGWDAREGARPDIWSPASSTWYSVMRYRAGQQGEPIDSLPDAAPVKSLFTSPLVIAVPQSEAAGFGAIGWKDLADRAARGDLRLGKTNPLFSTSGLNATIAAFTAFSDPDTPLGPEQVAREPVQQQIRQLEKSVVHYGENTLTFLGNLREAGAGYVSAVAVEESSLIAYNAGYPCGARPIDGGDGKLGGDLTCDRLTPPDDRLVPLYPSEGTLVSDLRTCRCAP
jgi:Ca-activated chloride channel family protein